MFFCEDCRKERDWPEGFRQSYGPCEVCGKEAGCWDVPSSALPDAPDPVEAGDECPNCQCGTLEDNGEELVCRGECGEVYK